MIRRLLTGLVFMLFVGTASAQYRVDRLITAGRSALYYEDYVLSIKYFNLAIGANLISTSLGITEVWRSSTSTISWGQRATPMRL